MGEGRGMDEWMWESAPGRDGAEVTREPCELSEV